MILAGEGVVGRGTKKDKKVIMTIYLRRVTGIVYFGLFLVSVLHWDLHKPSGTILILDHTNLGQQFNTQLLGLTPRKYCKYG